MNGPAPHDLHTACDAERFGRAVSPLQRRDHWLDRGVGKSGPGRDHWRSLDSRMPGWEAACGTRTPGSGRAEC